MLFAFVLGFLAGLFFLVAVEGAAAVWALSWIRRKGLGAAEAAEAPRDPPPGDFDFHLIKKGKVWILEQEKVSKASIEESSKQLLKEQSNKKNVLEVFPIKRYAEIKDHSLILSSSDGNKETIKLSNCTVVAVSASNFSSRKWSKKYPIKLEMKDYSPQNGSATLYIYLDTSWEKESWCKALRLASCLDKGKWQWHVQLAEDFNNYISSLNAEYTTFLKPAMSSGKAIEKANTDGSSGVRNFLKKLSKRALRRGVEGGKIFTSSSSHGKKKVGDKTHTLRNVSLSDTLSSSSEDNLSSYTLRDIEHPTSSYLSHFGNEGFYHNIPEVAPTDNFDSFDGTYCWNLFFSRLFFDSRRSIGVNIRMKECIQRILLNTRIPSYIGELTCSGLDLGNIPPYVKRMRVLPMEPDNIFAVEVDIEYSGGMLAEIEARLEVRDPVVQNDIKGTSIQSNITGEEDWDLLEGIEHSGSKLKSSNNLAGGTDDRNKVDKDDPKSPRNVRRTSAHGLRWKNVLHSIVEQVSQVPFSLAIQIVLLRGTLRIQIKPPPSDRLWYGFTKMPEINWNLKSSIGERKITSSYIATLIGNRLKVSIRDKFVLPNCESIGIPWMLGEDDDWIPRKAAPFIWISQEEPNSKTEYGISSSQAEEAKSTSSGIYGAVQDPIQQPVWEIPLSSYVPETVSSKQSLHDKREETDETMELPGSSSSGGVTMSGEGIMVPHDEADKTKRSSRRARMMEFGKRIGDKLEEKRHRMEENSRHFVEKMRENAR